LFSTEYGWGSVGIDGGVEPPQLLMLMGEGELNITFSLGDFALTVNVAGWNKHRSS